MIEKDKYMAHSEYEHELSLEIQRLTVKLELAKEVLDDVAKHSSSSRLKRVAAEAVRKIREV